MKELEGKVAVVTGSSKGIGAQIAKDLAGLGASVVVNYSTSKAAADEVVSQIASAGGQAVAVAGSVAHSEDVTRLFAETKRHFGKVDVLVNNAGIYSFAPLDDITEEMIHDMFGVNVTGLLLATKAASPLFRAEGGSIINIGSVVGETSPPQASVYAATKAAVNTITRSLAKELGPRKIRVNAVNAGPVATEGFKAGGLAGSPFEKMMIDNTPLGRIGTTEDVSSVVVFLVSDKARWITGSLLDAAGGWR